MARSCAWAHKSEASKVVAVRKLRMVRDMTFSFCWFSWRLLGGAPIFRRLGRGKLRHQHSGLAAIAQIFLAKRPRQIAFLELDGHQDVSRGHQGENKMRDRHHGRGPEDDQPADIKRV